jgi:hypothetical protein
MSASRRRMLLLLVPALAGLILTALAACGDGTSNSDRPLSSATASELRSTLAAVEQRVDDGDCDGAGDQAQTLERQAGSLPADVDADLRDALVDGASRLQALVVERCEPAAVGPTGPTTPPAPAPDENQQQNGGKDKQQKPGKDRGKSDNSGGGGDEDSGGVPIQPGEDGGGSGGEG